MTMTPVELKSALEAIIYAADEPATLEQMAAVLGEEKHIVRAALDELVASFASDERGVEIRAVAGGYRVYTKPQHHDLVRRFIKSLRPPLRLTMPALETLAVIAYKQPVTQPEIQEIRGVNCAGVIETLLEKRLITTAGRKQVIGRPILYRTSKEFLMRFGLGDVDELPSLKEFEALAREALGTDDGIAAEPETPEGEPLGEAALPPPESSADASESPGEAQPALDAASLPFTAESAQISAPPAAVEPAAGHAREAEIESALEPPHESKLHEVLEEAREASAEALGAIPSVAKHAAREPQAGAAESRTPESGAATEGGVADETHSSADRAARKAAPGSQ